MKAFPWVVLAALAAVGAAMLFGAVPRSYAGWPLDVMIACAAGGLLTSLLLGFIRKSGSPGSPSIVSAVDRSRPAARADRSRERAARLDERQAEVAHKATALKAAVLEQPATAEGNNVARVEGSEGRYIEVEKGNNAETGALEVTVTAYNYSGSKFNTHVHSRLLKIKGVKWDNPKNLGGGETNRKRQVKGTVVSTAMADVLAGIAAIK
jgi:hypothetical protein